MPSPKKSTPPRPLTRGEPVVQAVLAATLEELAHAGYGALRFEDIATRAGVNKTTIYRRWPTKSGLVRAALLSVVGEMIAPPNTGALRSDLLAMSRQMASLITSAQGQSIFRMLMSEKADEELFELTNGLREDHSAAPRQVIEQAIARGELPSGTDPLLVVETMIGAIHQRAFALREPITEAYLTQLVDLLLVGATHGGGRELAAPLPTSGREPGARRQAG
jgi:AcrR family transcriptional regulator